METYSRVSIGYASVNGIDFEIDPSSGMPRGMAKVNTTQSPELSSPWRPPPARWERWEDSMPRFDFLWELWPLLIRASYALAETFKYMYLCLLDPEESAALLPSDKWIFNTEAHPLPVFEWTQHEKANWDIR
jgi:hypothetical protein